MSQELERCGWRGLILSIILMMVSGLVFADVDDLELTTQLEFQKRAMQDRDRPITERSRAALESGVLLDQAARGAVDVGKRREYWRAASEILDEFNRLFPRHPQVRLFLVRSQIYRWAIADTWLWQFRLNPRDEAARTQANRLLTSIIDRLESARQTIGSELDIPSQLIRYRLAQAIADRAMLLANPDEARVARELALTRLNQRFPDENLVKHVQLLRGQILAKLGRGQEALEELDKSRQGKSSVTLEEWLEARVEAFCKLKQFESAHQAITDAKIAVSLRERLYVDLLAARYSTVPERSRVQIANEMAKRSLSLKDSDPAQARLALLAMARTLDAIAPKTSVANLVGLADGKLLLGQWEIAGDLLLQAAESVSKTPDIAHQYSLQACAALIQGQQYDRVEPILNELLQIPGEHQAKAGMLRALARGQALTARVPGATSERYREALREQVEKFANDSSADEARWLLGKLHLADRDFEKADQLWLDVRTSSTYWLNARRALIDLRLRQIEQLHLNGDKTQLANAVDALRGLLNSSRNQADPTANQQIFALALIQLDLSPGVVQAEEARLECDRIIKGDFSVNQIQKAQCWKILALSYLNRDRDAEELAKTVLPNVKAQDLIPIAYSLDLTAHLTSSDLQRRRVAALLGRVIDRIMQDVKSLPTSIQTEVKIREARRLFHQGDYDKAKDFVRDLNPQIRLDTLSDELLRDWADTLTLAGDFDQAAQVHQSRSRRSPRGSIEWLDARYGLAFALHRADRNPDARKLIESTALVYPELGGGKLQAKYQRLRQLLNEP